MPRLRVCVSERDKNDKQPRPRGWEIGGEERVAVVQFLTQVPSHQIGVVEILHSQSNDVDEFLYDLH